MLSLIELKGEFYQLSEKASEKIRFQRILPIATPHFVRDKRHFYKRKNENSKQKQNLTKDHLAYFAVLLRKAGNQQNLFAHFLLF